MKRKVLLKSLSIALVSICLILALVFNPKQTLSSNAKGTVVDSGSCGDNVKWKIDDEGNFYLYTEGTGSGQMYDKYNNTSGDADYPWEKYRSDIKNIYVQDGVTIINNGAFLNCSVLEDVSIGKDVKSIGKRAFYNCDSLSNISFEKNSSCTTIGYDAFSYSDSPLINISLPESINVIDGCPFSDSVGAVIGISSWKFFNSDTLYTILDSGVTYKLEKDIVAKKGDKSISINRDINLDLNGHIIDGTAIDEPAISVVGYTNCKVLGDGSIKGNETAIYLELIDDYDYCIGSISFISGNINVSGLKNGIYVDPCTSTYYGGEINIVDGSTKILGLNNNAIINGKLNCYGGCLEVCGSNVALDNVLINVDSENSASISSGSDSNNCSETSISEYNNSPQNCLKIDTQNNNDGTFNPYPMSYDKDYNESGYNGSIFKFYQDYAHYKMNIPLSAGYKIEITKNGVPVTLIKDVGTYVVTITNIYDPSIRAERYININKLYPSMTQLVKVPHNLKYNGEAQCLISEGGTCQHGTVKYSLDGVNYSTSFPSATDAGTYIVYIKIFGDENYRDVEYNAQTVTINKANAPTLVPSSIMEVNFEQKSLSDIQLPTGWSWDENDDQNLIVGENTSHTAYYTAADKNNYENITQNIVITRQECTHNSIEYVALKDSTCSEVGVMDHYECTICKKKFSDENGTTPVKDDELILNMLPHTEVAIDDVAPTCTQNGSSGGKKCSVCGTITEKPTVVNALGHNWGEWKRVKNPTTTETGLDERVCKNDPSHKETRVLNKLVKPSDQNTNNNSNKQTTKKSEKKYSNEWIGGKWYSADGSQSYKPVGKWNYNGTGWWFEDTSGYYPKSEWQKIEGKWYYFKSSGYMAKSEYIDGYWITSNGSMSETYNGGRWASDATGWWYVDSTGYYPSSEWVWIDEKCYYFKSNGYMATNQTIDGSYVGSDGSWQK